MSNIIIRFSHQVLLLNLSLLYRSIKGDFRSASINIDDYVHKTLTTSQSIEFCFYLVMNLASYFFNLSRPTARERSPVTFHPLLSSFRLISHKCVLSRRASGF